MSPQNAMRNLIREARAALPFDLTLDGDCEGRCYECPFRMLEFLDSDLAHWELRLTRGEVPSLGDLHSLGRACQETRTILVQQGLLSCTPGSPSGAPPG